MQKPTTVFKYTPFTTQSLLNLAASSVYFGSPRDFNDPYDCAITMSIPKSVVVHDLASAQREAFA